MSSAAEPQAAPGREARALRPTDVARSTTPVLIVVGLALVALLLTGNPVLSLALVVFVSIVWAMVHAPMRWNLMALVGAAIFADITPWDPRTITLWASLATPFQYLLLDNLNKLTGIGALRISGMEVALMALLALAGVRMVSRHSEYRADSTATPTVMLVAFAISAAGVIALALLGAANGGDMRQALWQFRHILWTPFLALLMAYAFRGPQDYRLLLAVLTATSSAKILVAAYYIFRVAHPAGYESPTATSHMDTVLFVSVLAIWAAIAFDHPTRSQRWMAIAVWSWTLFGMVINGRRTAIVSLIATLVLLVTAMPRRIKMRLVLGFTALLPVLIPYLILGRSRSSGVFGLASQFWSVFTQQDSSSITRDIENFNLIVTMKQHLLLGSGWGHEYIELVKADDISMFFAQYRYIAHNSVLWLLGIGGLVGFSMLWLPIVVGTFFAARARLFARTNGERIAAFASLAIIICYLLQAWSDMGVVSWTTSSLLAAALVMGAKLAVANGGWPAPPNKSVSA